MHHLPFFANKRAYLKPYLLKGNIEGTDPGDNVT